MSQLARLLELLRQAPGDDALTQQVLTQAIIQLLQKQRLLGEILLQVPRQITRQQDATMGLFWQADQIVLRVNPEKLADLRSDELVVLLEHEALHLLWQHPVRYANSPVPDLVTLATDIAVNQYLPETPRGTMTIAELQRLTRRKVQAHQDSGVYLHFLQELPETVKKRLKRADNQINPQAAASKIAKRHREETHQGWQADAQQPLVGNQQLRLAHLKRILHQAWAQTPKKDRGLLPGEVVATLSTVNERPAFNWRQLISRQLGTVAAGREEAAYRFNRRQPWRMELPGSVSRLVPQVLAFIDNSGSMTDEELSRALSEVSHLANNDRLPLEIYPFDARVHSEARQRLTNGRRVSYQRIGGGGTSFQCIFDFLHHQHINPTNSLVIIMTDGWGEQSINPYHYHHVDWLLTNSVTDLSVQHPVGHVLSLRKGQK